MWLTVKLGDVVSYAKSNAQGRSLPYVGMENIESETMKLVGEICVPESTSTTFVFDESHVLFGRLRPYLKKVLVPSFRGQCSTEIFCLKPSSELLREYLAYWLLEPTVSKKIDATSTGARMPRASMNKLLEFEFELPPLAEQQRIVGKLDAAFAEIDKAIELENTKRVELSTLTESYIEKLFNNEKYELHALSDVCEFVGGSQPPKSVFEYEKTDNNTRLIQIRDYKSDSHVTYIPTAKAKRFCDEQDVMIGRYGPPIFQILRGIKGAYNVALMKAVPKEGLDNDYLFHFLTNRKIQNYVINKSIRAAGQSGVNKDALEPYPIYLPPIDIQIKIVSEAKEINSYASVVLACIEEKLNQLKQLKGSLLQQELNPSEAA